MKEKEFADTEAIEIGFVEWEKIKWEALSQNSKRYNELEKIVKDEFCQVEKKSLKVNIDICIDKVTFYVMSSLNNTLLATIIIGDNEGFYSYIEPSSLTIDTQIWQQEELQKLLKRIVDKKQICFDAYIERKNMIINENAIMKDLMKKYKIK